MQFLFLYFKHFLVVCGLFIHFGVHLINFSSIVVFLFPIFAYSKVAKIFSCGCFFPRSVMIFCCDLPFDFLVYGF